MMMTEEQQLFTEGQPCQEFKIPVNFKTVSNAPMVGAFFMPMANPHPKETKHICEMVVQMQGNLQEEEDVQEGGYKDKLVMEKIQNAAFLQAVLTVHDVGSNAQSFVHLANSPQMTPFRDRVVFLHVNVPGQEFGAPDFVGDYPTMDQIAEMLPSVLDHFALDKCVAIGEGAGADIVCRFALDFPNRVAGIVLVHCTSVPHGIVGNLREILANLRLDDGQMNSAAWKYLMAHKIGHYDHDTKQQFIGHVRRELNEHNLSRFLHSFASRGEFTDSLKEHLANVDTVLVTGGKSPHNKNVFHMYDHMSKEKTALLVAENTVDVLREAPEYIVQALILLCQRHVFIDSSDSLKIQQSIESETPIIPPPRIELPTGPEGPNDRAEQKGPGTPLAKAASHPCTQDKDTDVGPPMAMDEDDGPPKQSALNNFPGLNPNFTMCRQASNRSFSSTCKFCGKECCWCNDMVTPGSPIE